MASSNVWPFFFVQLINGFSGTHNAVMTRVRERTKGTALKVLEIGLGCHGKSKWEQFDSQFPDTERWVARRLHIDSGPGDCLHRGQRTSYFLFGKLPEDKDTWMVVSGGTFDVIIDYSEPKHLPDIFSSMSLLQHGGLYFIEGLGVHSGQISHSQSLTLNRLHALSSALNQTRRIGIVSPQIPPGLEFVQLWHNKAILGKKKHNFSQDRDRINSWCLLLTATTKIQVNLENRYGVQQIDTSKRQTSYTQALDVWLRSMPELRIVLVENSGDNLTWAVNAARTHNPQRLLTVPIRPSVTCNHDEIGCHEGSAIYRSLVRRKRTDLFLQNFSHILKVTGRYAITSNLTKILGRCHTNWLVALQNPRWHVGNPPRQETQVLGFRKDLAESLFSWSGRGGMCMECHITKVATQMREAIRNGHIPRGSVCELPPFDVIPTKEGSTGKLRESIRRASL